MSVNSGAVSASGNVMFGHNLMHGPVQTHPQTEPHPQNHTQNHFASSANPAATGTNTNPSNDNINNSNNNNSDDDNDDDDDTRSMNKRKRASVAQIAALDDAFSMNPNPDSATRKLLAVKCGMTPRSVQIWFQNRRARIRLAERNGAQINPNDTAALQVINTVSKRGRKQGTYYPKKPDSAEGGSPKPAPSNPPRRGAPKYKPTPAVYGNQNGATGAIELLPTPPNSMMPPYQNGAGSMSNGYPPQQQQQMFHHQSSVPQAGMSVGPGGPPKMHAIPIDTLLWGSWRRTLTPLTQTMDPTPDLQMHMDPMHRQLYITITSGGGQFRIEIPFDSVSSITVEDRHYSTGEGGADMVVTAVTFGLAPIPPRFYMQLPPNLNWIQCSDFTENSQGTSVPLFTVLAGGGVDGVGTGGGGYESEVMKGALAEVVTGDKWLSGCIVTPPEVGQQHPHEQVVQHMGPPVSAPGQHQQQMQYRPYDSQQHVQNSHQQQQFQQQPPQQQQQQQQQQQHRRQQMYESRDAYGGQSVYSYPSGVAGVNPTAAYMGNSSMPDRLAGLSAGSSSGPPIHSYQPLPIMGASSVPQTYNPQQHQQIPQQQQQQQHHQQQPQPQQQQSQMGHHQQQQQQHLGVIDQSHYQPDYASSSQQSSQHSGDQSLYQAQQQPLPPQPLQQNSQVTQQQHEQPNGQSHQDILNSFGLGVRMGDLQQQQKHQQYHQQQQGHYEATDQEPVADDPGSTSQ
ncbi:hypothetical protein HDU77_009847 [Chytriomyces hyalinus]|nr:hypothetical protein HDU77_009847 [Chytriomyces hyalinus]